MPVTLVQSGPSFDRDGIRITPMAEHRVCDECGEPNAAFGETVNGQVRVLCGWADGRPVCKAKQAENAENAA